jgi:hypothetical protein
MVESMHRQGFACLRGERRTEKRGFRKRAAASRKLGHNVLYGHAPFICSQTCDARQTLLNSQAIDRIDLNGGAIESAQP